jgi:SOS response regulatory protein OraA/RecX
MKTRDLALKYLTNRSRSIKEMKYYLNQMKVPLLEIEDVVQQLCEEGYLDDLAYGMEYIRYATLKNKAKRRIQSELQQKGVSDELFQQAWNRLSLEEGMVSQDPGAERKKAEELVALWWGQKDFTEKNLRKAATKLKTLGYDTDTIYHTLGKWMGKLEE